MNRQQWIDIGYEALVSIAVVASFMAGTRSAESYFAGIVLWLGLLLGYVAGRTFHP